MEDALDDAWEFAKGLYQIIPTTVRGWKEIANTDPEAFKQLLSNPETPGHAKDMGLAVWSAIKEPYQKHGASVVVRRPVTFLSDALTVLTLGGGSIAKAGRLAKAAGAGARAEKVIAAGEALQKLPGKLARKAIDKGVLTASGGKYDLAKRREWLTLKREELGGASVRFAEDMEKIGKQIMTLNDKEAELFHKVRVFGDDLEHGVSIATLKANPKVAKAYGSYRKLAKQVWEENLKRRGVLDDAEAVSAIEKKFAAEAFGKVDDASIAAARERLAKVKVKPTYGPSIHPAEAGKFSVLDNLFEASPSKEAGKVGFLEKFTGAQGAIKDPRIYVPKAIENYRKAEAKFRLTERTLESPHLTKNAQFAQGFDRERVPQGIHRKYFDDSIRAEAVDAITDPTIKRLLRQEFTFKANSVVKLYDSMLHLFRKSATRWNPRWYTGNAVGDAVLGSIAGADWVEGYRNLKKGSMPQEILAKHGMSNADTFFQKEGMLDRAVDVSNQIDQATRAGIITREVGNRLKAAAISFEGSAEVMEDVLRSTQNFSDLQVELRLLQEEVARGSEKVQKLDRLIVKLEQRDQALSAKLVESETKAAQRGQQGLTSAWMAESGATVKGDVAKLQNEIRSIDASIQKLDDLERDLTYKLYDVTEPKRSASPKERGLQKARVEAGERTQLLGERAAILKAKAERKLQELKKAQESVKAITIHNDQVIAYAKRKLEKAKPRMEKVFAKREANGQKWTPEMRRAVFQKVYEQYRQEGVQRVRRATGPMIEKYKEELQGLNAQFIASVRKGQGVKTGAAFADPDYPKFKPDLRAERIGKNLEEIANKRKLLEGTRSQRVAVLKESYSSRRSQAAATVDAAKQKAIMGSAGERGFEGSLEKLTAYRQRLSTVRSYRDAVVRDIADDLIKSGKLEQRIPGLTEQVEIARHAVDRANAFLGDYLGLSGFEQAVMRRIIPFYPWSKAMTMLAFRLPFLSPVKTFMWNRYSMLMWDQLGDKELEAKAPYTKGYVPIFARQDGSTVWLPFGSFSPFSGLRTSKMGEIPMPGMFAVHESSPAISLIYRFLGGRTEFDRGNVPYGEPLVNIANGDIWKFREDGMLEKDLPQTPFVSGLVHMFPLTQFIEDVITPYSVDKYDNVGFPQPKLKSDGSYMYPREWWQRLAALGGVKLVNRSRESFIRSGNIKIRQAVKGLRKLYLRSGPEERETIREYMRDYARGEYRRIAQ